MREEIERVLLEKGVSAEHIERMKKETSINIHEYLNHYENTGLKKVELVDTQKIKGVGIRVDNVKEMTLYSMHDLKPVVYPEYKVDYKNLSWFDYISIKDERLNLDYNRIMKILDHFKTKKLEENYNYYEENGVDPGSGSLTRLIYFMDEDIYATGGDGTHRTLFAKVSNAPYLKAEVSYYERKPL